MYQNGSPLRDVSRWLMGYPPQPTPRHVNGKKAWKKRGKMSSKRYAKKR